MATILIVDDEKNVRAIFCAALSNKHNVIEASNGQEGLDMFKQYCPDLIITDLRLPVISGIDLVQKIRSSHSKVKIIAIGALVDQPAQRSAMLEAGADLCLPKPVALSKLEQAITGLLSC